MIGMKSKSIREFKYKIDPRLKNKLDLLAKTLKKKDVWILIDGDEGTGKTNTAVYLMEYFSCITGREYSVDNFYFESDAMFDWVKDHSEGLICWDEAALGGLSAEWYNQAQMNLLKFAMTGRKKHHIFILCIPRFNKLKEDLRKERIHAMIHMDLGKKGDDYGHFVYLTRRGIRALNRTWERTKMKLYARYAQRCGGFFCNINIPWVLPELIDETEYEAKKDRAISSIGQSQKKENKIEIQRNKQLDEIKVVLGCLPINMRKEIAIRLNLTERAVRMWKDLKREPIKESETQENEPYEAENKSQKAENEPSEEENPQRYINNFGS